MATQADLPVLAQASVSEPGNAVMFQTELLRHNTRLNEAEPPRRSLPPRYRKALQKAHPPPLLIQYNACMLDSNKPIPASTYQPCSQQSCNAPLPLFCSQSQLTWSPCCLQWLSPAMPGTPQTLALTPAPAAQQTRANASGMSLESSK